MGRRQTIFVLGTIYWHHVRLFTEEPGPHPGTQALRGELCEAGYSVGGPRATLGSRGWGRCAHRGRHTPRGAPSRTKVPSLAQVWEGLLSLLDVDANLTGVLKVWSRKEKKGK